MPFKSKAQARYLHANAKRLGLDMKEWDESTDWKNLPDKKTAMNHIATEHLTKLAASYLQAVGDGLRYAVTPELNPTANMASARGAVRGGVVGAGLGSGVAIGADALDGSLDPTPESYLVAPVIGGVMGMRAGSHDYDRPRVA